MVPGKMHRMVSGMLKSGALRSNLKKKRKGAKKAPKSGGY